jgi:hypothetical protein
MKICKHGRVKKVCPNCPDSNMYAVEWDKERKEMNERVARGKALDAQRAVNKRKAAEMKEAQPPKKRATAADMFQADEARLTSSSTSSSAPPKQTKSTRKPKPTATALLLTNTLREASPCRQSQSRGARQDSTKVMAPHPTKLEDAASVTGEFKPVGSPMKPLYSQIQDTNKAVRQLQTMAGLSADKQTLAAPTTAQLANSLRVATRSWKLIEKAVRERAELTLELDTKLTKVSQLERKMECIIQLNKALHDRALQAEERMKETDRRLRELELMVRGGTHTDRW